MPNRRKPDHQKKAALSLKPSRKKNRLKGVCIGVRRNGGFLLGGLLLLTGIYLVIKPYLAQKAAEDDAIPVNTVSTDSAFSPASTGPFKIDPQLFSDRPRAEAPLRIIIPARKIDLPVVPAKVKNGTWETSETSASHGIGSAYPGEEGNIVIFAHAREKLFLPLRNISENENIYLLTVSGWHRYRVETLKLVNPDEVEEIKKTETETLTLFTCTGFLDSKRLIVKAVPIP